VEERGLLANRRCSALTLTELLVLLAITAILSAMLLPLFATSRDRARQAGNAGRRTRGSGISTSRAVFSGRLCGLGKEQ